ncbi:MAG: fibronectin type III domain-containing protein, partial [Patescibacteria group bacterium]
SSGTYFISVAGTFGDSGSIALPIRSGADGIAVNAIVPSTGGGGGGSGGGGGTTVPAPVGSEVSQVDQTAPVLSGIVVSSIGKTSATVSWTTNEDSNSKVYYGLTSAFESGFVFDTVLTKTHSMILSGLSEGTTYSFQVRSADVSNNIATSSNYTFSTLDETVPVLSGIRVDSITRTAATIHWTTNEKANSVLDYGLATDYGTTKNDATLFESHTFVVSGLASGTLYHFRVKSTDSFANSSVSSDQTFQTLVDASPGNVSGTKATPGDKVILLEWVNPIEDDLAGVRVLKCVNAYPKAPVDAACSVLVENLQATSLNVTGLTNNTTYYFGIFAKDLASQFASGALVLGKPSAPEKEMLEPKKEDTEPPKEPVKESVTVPGNVPEKSASGSVVGSVGG